MEQNKSTPHPDYLKGFNEGYLMAENMPALTEKLAEAIGKSPRSEGFKDGRDQFILEKEKDRYPTWLKSDRLSNLKKSDKSKDKDKDDMDRDK